MKIICFIRPEPQYYYFINKINEKHKLNYLVVQHRSMWKRLKRKVKQEGLMAFFNVVKSRLHKTKDFNKVFGDYGKEPNLPYIDVENINSPAVEELLDKEKPDLVLVNTASIIKSHILSKAKLFLNVHPAILPFYRGTFCSVWAMLNNDLDKIGVTIHKINEKVDAGEIISKKRIEINKSDTIHDVITKSTFIGTELVLDILKKLDDGEELEFQKQDLSKSKLYKVEDFKRLKKFLKGF